MKTTKKTTFWWAVTSIESMDGGSGWDEVVHGPYRTKSLALRSAGVRDGEIEVDSRGQPQHRFCVNLLEAPNLESIFRQLVDSGTPISVMSTTAPGSSQGYPRQIEMILDKETGWVREVGNETESEAT